MQTDILEEMYRNKQADYFSLEREIFKNAITGSGLVILDIGCGTGVLGKYFMSHQQCKVYGIEINSEAYEIAKDNLVEVIRANVETLDLPYKSDMFDIVIMGDVLEHLVNPIGAISKLMRVLKPGGKILITVPNVRHWKVIFRLLCRDEWKYMPWGILDYTHLRFFTKSSIIGMMNENGFNVTKADWVIQKPSKSSLINKVTFGLFSGLLASHTFLTLQK